MQFYSVKKRFITLIEIMIVMFLIALITGVLAYNYRGSLDEGKAFKTKTAIEKLETILDLEIAKDPSLLESISENWKGVVERSSLVKNPKDLQQDGWGYEFRVERDPDNRLVITSEAYNEYQRKKTQK